MPFPSITPTVPTLVRSSAARFGDRAFLIAAGEELSYVELEQRSSRLANSLLSMGLGKNDHVGILMPNSIQWAVAWFAVTRIGAVAVPLNTFYKASELAWTTRHADLRAILADEKRTNEEESVRIVACNVPRISHFQRQSSAQGCCVCTRPSEAHLLTKRGEGKQPPPLA